MKSNNNEIELKRIDKIALESSNSDLTPVLNCINKYFDGNMYQLAEGLDKVLYMIHYLPYEEFTERERQSASFTLMELKRSLLKAFFMQQAIRKED